MDWAPFSSEGVRDVLLNKSVVIIGDSVQRGIYKDLVLLLQTDQFLEDVHLKTKGEKNFSNDELIDGGQMTNSTDYIEVRQYHTPYHRVRFYFVTRCYGHYMETILADLTTEPSDIVIMNSCLWDISRYGPFPTAMEEYKVNLQNLCVRMKQTLPDQCLFIWNTALPVGKKLNGGFMTHDIKWMENHLTYLVDGANSYAVKVMVHHGFDVKDLHYHFANPAQQLGLHAPDGIHWDPRAHRNITFIILRHICRAWEWRLFKQQRGIPSSAMLRHVVPRWATLYYMPGQCYPLATIFPGASDWMK